MPKHLVIVESAGKIKKIGEYLGSDYIVKASFGHVQDLDKKTLSIEIENNFNPLYITSPDKTKVVKELKGLVKVMAPTNKNIGTSKIEQQEPGNMQFSIYQKTLDDMGVEIFMGDYIGYYESEDRVRYYTVSDDGYVKSDNKHTYGGYKPFYRTVIATYVSENEFRGI